MAEVKKENWFKRRWNGLTKWFRGMKSELKKVVWPSWSQVLNNTLVVIVVSVIFAIVIGLIDYLAYKGIVALLIRVLSDHTPQEILDADLYFIDEIGLKEHLSPTRSNGLVAMVKQMRVYALAFSAKA